MADCEGYDSLNVYSNIRPSIRAGLIVSPNRECGDSKDGSMQETDDNIAVQQLV